MTGITVFGIAACAAAAIAAPASAQSVTKEDLQAALRQRDQVIAALEKRIAALETQQGATAVKAPPASATASVDTSAADSGDSGEDLVALQALSRGLVQRGLLLLPKGGLEFSPGIAYNHT